MRFILLLGLSLALFGSDFALMKQAFDKGDINRAITYARLNAMKGDVGAMYDLGLLYYAKGDARKAKTWLERSVKNGGKGTLGVSLLLFIQSQNRDGYKRVMETLVDAPPSKISKALMAVSRDLATNRRDASSEDYLLLGELFSSDRLIRKDMRTALFLTNQAAKKGDPKALERMGDAYWKSSYTQGALIVAPHTVNSMEIALEYYQKAAELGNMDAMAKSGRLYIEAPWIINNSRLGVELILKAAEVGSPLGAKMAAELYWNGVGVRRDRKVSLEWYEKATEVCDVNRILAQFYGKDENAQRYLQAYRQCKDDVTTRDKYHLLFEPF